MLLLFLFFFLGGGSQCDLEIKQKLVSLMELWNRGAVEPWNRGTVGPWNRGTVEPWNRGTILLAATHFCCASGFANVHDVYGKRTRTPTPAKQLGGRESTSVDSCSYINLSWIL